jgi:hypothetical protein
MAPLRMPRRVLVRTLLLLKMKEKKLLKIQPLPKVLQLRNIYNCYTRVLRKKEILLLVKMKEKKLLKIRSLPKVLRAQAMRSTT